MKIGHEPQSSAHVLPFGCIADNDVYDALYISCFAALVCCAGQASCITLAMWMLHDKKIVDELPAPTMKWCRGIMFTGVVFCLLPFLCFTSILNNFLFAKVSLFSCLPRPAKVLFIVGDVALALVGSTIFTTGAYITMYCT